MLRVDIRRVLRADVWLNAAGFVLLTAAAPWLATAIRLEPSWAVWFIPVAVLLATLLHARIAANPARRSVRLMIMLDIGLAALTFTLAVADPSDAATFVRVALGATAVLALAMGTLKAFGLQTLHLAASPGNGSES